MRQFAFAVAAAALLTLPLPASAGPAATDISSQSIEVGPGGVRVGHDRFDSRRRDRRVHDRFESRRRDRVIVRDRRDCRTVTIRERLPGGGVKVVKRREC